MLCNNCGQENSSDAIVCSNCEQRLSDVEAQTPPPLTAINIAKDTQVSAVPDGLSAKANDADRLLASFVGKKYDDFYHDKWFKKHVPTLIADNKSFNIQSFNFAGFLLGASWLCYRKMYLVAFFIILSINVVDLVLMHLLGMEAYNNLGQTSFFIAWAVLTGILGNYFYFNHSVKNIEKVMNNTADPVMVEQELAAKGGTSWVGGIVGSILVVLLSIGISYFFAPDWYWLE